jgi:uncharacterized membrane protein required for colicin V production
MDDIMIISTSKTIYGVWIAAQVVGSSWEMLRNILEKLEDRPLGSLCVLLDVVLHTSSFACASLHTTIIVVAVSAI